MASRPPGKCCTIVVRHDGETKGEYRNIGDVETYFAFPADKSTDKAILFVTDIFGHRFKNPQLLADQFAEQGYLTVIPDLFNGNPAPVNMPDDFDVMKWLKGPPSYVPSTIDPIIDAAIVELRSEYNVKKLGAVGYCFGGKYVVRHLRPAEQKIEVGFTAHPSFVEADELMAIEGPLSIAAAEIDSIFPAEKRHETEVILAETKQPYQLSLFSGVEHGFSTRANLSNTNARFAKEQAFIQAVSWFNHHLA